MIETPIAFLTGHGDIPNTLRDIRVGASDFLAAPVDDTKMLDTSGKATAMGAKDQVRAEDRRTNGTRRV
jgi:FixJ family two-component response regulator